MPRNRTKPCPTKTVAIPLSDFNPDEDFNPNIDHISMTELLSRISKFGLTDLSSIFLEIRTLRFKESPHFYLYAKIDKPKEELEKEEADLAKKQQEEADKRNIRKKEREEKKLAKQKALESLTEEQRKALGIKL